MSAASNPGFSEEALRPLIEKLVSEAVAKFIQENELRARELSLMERIIRVEEELKALREIQLSMLREMNARFEAIDKRFEAIDKRFEAIDKRFEAMDKRFEALQREMDKRFEAMEKRLNFMQWFMGAGFALLTILVTLFRFLH